MTGNKIFKEVPILTENNCEQDLVVYDNPEKRKKYYGNLKDCVEVIKKKYKDIVTGLWYVKETDIDGGAYFIFRTKEEVDDPDLRGKIHTDIWNFTFHAFLYHMTGDSTEGLFDLPVEDWKKYDMVYALYDTERGIG